MKFFHKLIGFVLSLTIMTLISGCGGGGGTTTASNTGQILLNLTDAPTDDENVKGVYVTFNALRYQYADSNDSWQDVDLNESRTINLLDLQDGNTTLLNQVELPAGYLLQWGGQFENQQRASARLALVVPVSLLLIFLLLFTTFGSIRQAVLVFSNIPLAMIGGVFALWLSGEYLSVPASIGFIALLGVAVPNSIVLLSYFNQLRATGMSLAEVIIVGTERRLRPVLMTASLTAFGLLPMLFATGPGSEIQRPLAIVVIGGLVSSTFLTLILLPILYKIFGKARQDQV